MDNDEKREVEMLAGLMTAAGLIDPHLAACPNCGAPELRAESRVEWRPLAEVCHLFGVTAEDVRSSGANVSALGMVKSAVPYVTCMACGLDADASKEAFL